MRATYSARAASPEKNLSFEIYRVVVPPSGGRGRLPVGWNWNSSK